MPTTQRDVAMVPSSGVNPRMLKRAIYARTSKPEVRGILDSLLQYLTQFLRDPERPMGEADRRKHGQKPVMGNGTRHVTAFQLLQAKFMKETPSPPITRRREVGVLVPWKGQGHSGGVENVEDIGGTGRGERRTTQGSRGSSVQRMIARFAAVVQKEREEQKHTDKQQGSFKQIGKVQQDSVPLCQNMMHSPVLLCRVGSAQTPLQVLSLNPPILIQYLTLFLTSSYPLGYHSAMLMGHRPGLPHLLPAYSPLLTQESPPSSLGTAPCNTTANPQVFNGLHIELDLEPTAERAQAPKTAALIMPSVCLPPKPAFSTPPPESLTSESSPSTPPSESLIPETALSALPPESLTPETAPSAFPPESLTPETAPSALPPESLTLETAPSALPPESLTPETAPSAFPPESLTPETAPSALPPEPLTPETAPSALPPESLTPETAPSAFPPESLTLETAPSALPPESLTPETAPSAFPPESLTPETAPSAPPPEPLTPETAPSALPPESLTPKTAPSAFPPESLTLETAPSALPPESLTPETAPSAFPPESLTPETAPSAFPPEFLTPETAPSAFPPESLIPETTPSTLPAESITPKSEPLPWHSETLTPRTISPSLSFKSLTPTTTASSLFTHLPLSPESILSPDHLDSAQDRSEGQEGFLWVKWRELDHDSTQHTSTQEITEVSNEALLESSILDQCHGTKTTANQILPAEHVKVEESDPNLQNRSKYKTRNYAEAFVKQPFKPKTIRFADTFTF
ncbi:hypothetical protein JZ751_028097 [Albula glossodonta]|uniref:Uncharacterized protein n=1 Tax=Albula glossodonta TaxID=121402 RepID=A0A8T2PBN9_9TELE|nr:hypothetical protein JZ751_028097 [Albula glossodonta]